MPWLRAFGVWLIIAAAESVHGTLRALFLMPYLGDFRSRQISVFPGSLLILAIAFLFIRWIDAPSTRSLVQVGLFWVALTILFEITLGRLILGFSWERLFSDYDVPRGGLLGFGLLFMAVTPLFSAKLRGERTQVARS